jgi:hypothetical protein
MPRRLLDRCNPDSIQEYRAAARERFHDGLAMAGRGRRTGAIYLWGYAAEMFLKAAYFSVIGTPETRSLTWGADLRPAILRGRGLGEGASTLLAVDKPQLRFATEEEAEAARSRLGRRLPGSEQVWIVTQEAGRVDDFFANSTAH